MKSFRPAAASISLGCREFNLCLFVGAEIMFLMCVFVSPFYTSSPVWFFLCHFLDLRFLSSLLSVSVSSSFSPSSLPAPYLEHMTVFFLFCGLLARCCLVRHLSKQNGQKHSIEQSKTLSAESAPCFLLPSFSSWCRWTPPQLDSDNFSGNFFECLAAGEKFLRISLHSRYGFCTLVSSTLEDSCFCPSEAEAVFKLALADASSKGYRPRWLLCRPSIGPGRFIFIPS